MPQLSLEEIFALNHDCTWREHVNCYGAAIGIRAGEAHAAGLGYGPEVGDLSAHLRVQAFQGGATTLPLESAFSTPAERLRYLLLTDGARPLGPASPPPRDGAHIFTGSIIGGDYHFFWQAEPGIWACKNGTQEGTTVWRSQSIVTDIDRALHDSNLDAAQHLGFYQALDIRPRVGRFGAPPPYHPDTVTALNGIWERIADTQPRRIGLVAAEACKLGLAAQIRRPDLKRVAAAYLELSA